MAYRDDWRSDRSRTGPFADHHGNWDRWRSAQRQQNLASTYPADRDELFGVGFRRRGWRPGSDYYGNNPDHYGGGNYEVGSYEAGYSGNPTLYQGQFRGRGPKGYRRSDERIRDDVCERLTADDRIDASNIDVTVKDGEVTLSGTTSSREDKHHAEDIANSVSGVTDVSNRLRAERH